MIPSIPSIPTDNFYKFLTFVSSIVFLSLVGTLLYINYYLDNKTREFNKQKDLVKNSIQYYKNEANEGLLCKMELEKYLYEKYFQRKLSFLDVYKLSDSLSKASIICDFTDINTNVYKKYKRFDSIANSIFTFKTDYYKNLLYNKGSYNENYVLLELIRLDSINTIKSLEIDKELISSDFISDEIDYINSLKSKISFYIFLMQIMSFICVIYGIVKWRKYQNIQDSILLLTEEKLKSELFEMNKNEVKELEIDN